MDGVGGTLVKRILGKKPQGQIELRGGFRPNAASTPTVFRGPAAGMFTVAYSATGIYTVTFSSNFPGLKFPPSDLPAIDVMASMVDVTNTNRFQPLVVGGYVNSTRSFIIQAWQDTAAFAVPSNAANWIDFMIHGSTNA
jgi:hypothetical protein